MIDISTHGKQQKKIALSHARLVAHEHTAHTLKTRALTPLVHARVINKLAACRRRSHTRKNQASRSRRRRNLYLMDGDLIIYAEFDKTWYKR